LTGRDEIDGRKRMTEMAHVLSLWLLLNMLLLALLLWRAK
jgi:hypothetical protein